jgi:hypothetical protein
MDIIIQEPLNHFAMKLYQGSRWRYPSMTDVKFLDNQYIIVAHRFSGKIYVIHIDEVKQSFTIIDNIQLKHNNKPYQTESFIVLNNTIYMLSYSNIMTFIDILPNYHLQQRQSFLKLVNQDIPFHGITKKDHLIYVTPSRKHTGTEYILSYNTLNNQLSNVATLGDNIRVKSLAFLSNGLIVVLVNFKENSSMIETSHFFNGEIRLYSEEFVLLDYVDVPYTHFDCICSDQCNFYGTGANLQNGYIFIGKVNGNTIETLYAYQVNDFPHGIDILDNKIAYTSYSTSGIHFLEKSEISNDIEKTVIYRKVE